MKKSHLKNKVTKRVERLNNILNTLKVKGGSTVKDLALYLNVSDMTIRRDLSLLEGQGLVKIFHGSVVYNQECDDQTEYSVVMASEKNVLQKQNIAKRAASLVEPGDMLIIDIGSTAEALTRALPEAIPLTIICYGVNILREIVQRPNTELIFTGGRFHRDTQMFESNKGIALIREHRATKAFISAAGIDLKLGVTTINSYEIETKRAALESSLTRILIADSSKFGKVMPAHFAEITDFDVIITDKAIDTQYSKTIIDYGIDLILV